MRLFKRLVIGTFLAAAPFATLAQVELSNPIGTTNIPVIIGNIVKALLGLSGAVALLVFVWSGVLMIVAAGNADHIKKAKSSIVWATIGLVVIFTAYTIVTTLVTALSTGSGQ
jgi:hypothetical protein